MENIKSLHSRDIINQKLEQEQLRRLVIEVRAKNGMTRNRMNRALERLGKTSKKLDLTFG
ncbi:MAG: hypothetical protein LUQ38_02625 [Methanotrichaceae archaeon]|nr:hypothetical protein [Methanotrichaceae archaeon]